MSPSGNDALLSVSSPPPKSIVMIRLPVTAQSEFTRFPIPSEQPEPELTAVPPWSETR